MRVYVNEITGIDDAITTMYFSKGSWTKELDDDIRKLCTRINDRRGCVRDDVDVDDYKRYKDLINRLVKWGVHHVTMLRFIDLSITVEGLHRAGQDDWDAHAARYGNRIIRASSRLQTLECNLSEWYDDKAITTDKALKEAGITKPESLIIEGEKYVASPGGYVKEEYARNKDVMRGLYPLGFPSNFIFRVNLTEYAHVYKMRKNKSGANPEVSLLAETICDQLENMQSWITRDLLERIEN